MAAAAARRTTTTTTRSKVATEYDWRSDPDLTLANELAHKLSGGASSFAMYIFIPFFLFNFNIKIEI